MNLHQLKGGENEVSQMLVAMSRMRVSQILYNLSPRTKIFIHSGFCLFEEQNNLRSWLISVSTDLVVSDGKLNQGLWDGQLQGRSNVRLKYNNVALEIMLLWMV